MMEPCDLVAERVALGEPLGDVAEHAASCPRCRRLAALPAELGAAHRDSDPGMGFTARVTVGAQHRLAARRRRRIAVGASTAVAAAAAGTFLFVRSPEAPREETPPPSPAMANNAHQPTPAPEPGAVDSDVKSLVQLANVERSGHVTARWAHITKPLSPYRALVKGITP
jgi:hypothetical protein